MLVSGVATCAFGPDWAKIWRRYEPALRSWPETDYPNDCAAGARTRRRIAGPGTTPRRRSAVSGDYVPFGVESSKGNAVQLDAESVPRLHARLPLLLRASLPNTVRAWT